MLPYEPHFDRNHNGKLEYHEQLDKEEFLEKKSSVPDGCYVATCVYGSYDCPEVWALRRFRDTVLARSAAGRCFIRGYYRISPGLVRRFGERQWFRSFCRKRLDSFISLLKRKGIETTPYHGK